MFFLFYKIAKKVNNYFEKKSACVILPLGGLL